MSLDIHSSQTVFCIEILLVLSWADGITSNHRIYTFDRSFQAHVMTDEQITFRRIFEQLAARESGTIRNRDKKP